MEHTRKVTFALALLAGAVFFRCGQSPTEVGGGAVENGNAFTGRMISTGGAPVVNALVRIDLIGAPPKLYSATTDALGRYEMTKVAAGYYRLSAEGRLKNDSLFTSRDSVYMPSRDALVDLGTDTLLAPAGIYGIVRKSGAADHAGIIVYVPGQSFLAVTDTNGHFLLLNLPPDPMNGYRLRFIDPEGKYTGPEISGIKVQKGIVDTLTDTVRLYSVDIPRVTGLSSDFDSLRLTGMVKWSGVADPSVIGYNLYRDWLGHTLFTQTPLNTIPVGDTFFVDSTLLPKETYIYRVKAVNGLGVVGNAFSDPDTLRPVSAYLWPDSEVLSVVFDSSQSTALLYWDKIDAEFVNGYRLYRNIKYNDLNFDLKVEMADTFFVDTLLTPGQTYVYRVKAVNRVADVGFTYSERETLAVH